MNSAISQNLPDARGHFGPYGGRFVPETLMHPLQELEEEYLRAEKDPEFQREFEYYLKEFCGRPTPLYFAERLTRELGGAKIYLKREDLLHTGAHKINNCIGQILLARRMGKTRIIAETGAGQHGVATATVAAMFGLKCVIYMGAVDCERQALNVFRMKMLGAEVVPVKAGQETLKEAINEARRQILEQEKRLPDMLIACVGGGSNAMGLFYPFLNDDSVKMVGVEAGGEGIQAGKHAARFQGGSLGVLQGTRSYLLQDEFGQIQLTHSVSAGLDYAAVGPEHAWLRDQKRVEYTYATDAKALEAFMKLASLEGIIPALESAHAIAEVIKRAPKMGKGELVIVNLSGRGDKDVSQAAVELSSVNRKQSEISVNLPREMEMLEAQIRDIINRYVARGRLTVRVGLHAGASKQSARMHLNIPLAKAYAKEL